MQHEETGVESKHEKTAQEIMSMSRIETILFTINRSINRSNSGRSVLALALISLDAILAGEESLTILIQERLGDLNVAGVDANHHSLLCNDESPHCQPTHNRQHKAHISENDDEPNKQGIQLGRDRGETEKGSVQNQGCVNSWRARA